MPATASKFVRVEIGKKSFRHPTGEKLKVFKTLDGQSHPVVEEMKDAALVIIKGREILIRDDHPYTPPVQDLNVHLFRKTTAKPITDPERLRQLLPEELRNEYLPAKSATLIEGAGDSVEGMHVALAKDSSGLDRVAQVARDARKLIAKDLAKMKLGGMVQYYITTPMVGQGGTYFLHDVYFSPASGQESRRYGSAHDLETGALIRLETKDGALLELP